MWCFYHIERDAMFEMAHLNTCYLGLYFRKTRKSSVLDGRFLSCPHAFPQHVKILQPVQLELLKSHVRAPSPLAGGLAIHCIRLSRMGRYSPWLMAVYSGGKHVIGNWMLCSDMPWHQWNPTGNGGVKMKPQAYLVAQEYWGMGRVCSHKVITRCKHLIGSLLLVSRQGHLQ